MNDLLFNRDSGSTQALKAPLTPWYRTHRNRHTFKSTMRFGEFRHVAQSVPENKTARIVGGVAKKRAT